MERKALQIKVKPNRVEKIIPIAEQVWLFPMAQ